MVCNQHKLHSSQKGSCRNWANTRSNGLPFTVILTIEVGHSLGYRMVSPTLKFADIAGALQGNATDDGSSFSTGSLSEQNFLQNQRLATKP
jgi:hypothetical protein